MRDPDALRDTARVLLVLAALAAAGGCHADTAGLVERAAALIEEAGPQNGTLEEATATV